MRNKICAARSWGVILLPLLYWLVSVWENRNHIQYFLQKGFNIVNWLQSVGRVGGMKKATVMPPRDQSTQEGATVLRGYRSKGGSGGARAPKYCTLENTAIVAKPGSQGLPACCGCKSLRACSPIDTLRLVTDAAEIWSSSVAH